MANKPSLPCGGCGQPVYLTGKRYKQLIAERRYPIGRACGCASIKEHLTLLPFVEPLSESPDDAETPEAARSSDSVELTHLRTAVFEPGKGKRGHQHAPLANGKIKRRPVTG